MPSTIHGGIECENCVDMHHFITPEISDKTMSVRYVCRRRPCDI